VESSNSRGCQGRAHDDLDPLDLFSPRTGKDGLQHRLHPRRGRVMYNEQAPGVPAINGGLRHIHIFYLTSEKGVTQVAARPGLGTTRSRATDPAYSGEFLSYRLTRGGGVSRAQPVKKSGESAIAAASHWS